MKNKQNIWRVVFGFLIISIFVACRANDCGCP
jgi:hypothetical protein